MSLSGSGTVTSADVGTSKTITVGSLALSDGTGTASNYTITGGTHTLDVTQAVLSSSGSRTYDATTTAAAADQTLSGLQNSETLTLSGSGTVTSADVGTNKTITLGSLAISDDTGTAANYTLIGGTHLLSITGSYSTSTTTTTTATQLRSQIKVALQETSSNGSNVSLLPTTTNSSIPEIIENFFVSTPDESLTVNPCVMQSGYCN